MLNKHSLERIEKAIVFLVYEYSKSGRGRKPVILHSVRIALYLLKLGYGENVVIAALLHDLLEDSNVALKNIQTRFGKEIAAIVSAVSYNPNVINKKTQYQELFLRAKQHGAQALLVKCADLYDNSFFINLVYNKKREGFLIQKIKYFLEISHDHISTERPWKDLRQRHRDEMQRVSLIN